MLNYKPNKTKYLDSTTKEELKKYSVLNKDNLEAGTYATQLYERILIDLAWNSSRLEGNTYSYLETSRLLKNNDSSEKRDPKETQMILNHKSAIEFLVRDYKDIGLNRFTILNVHALLSENLLNSPDAEGRIRNIAVGIRGSSFNPLEIPQLIEEYFNLIIKKANEIEDPFEQSFFLMVQLPYLQPFEDVNKRVSRLVANIPFIKNNLSPLSFIDVPTKDYLDGILAVYEHNEVDLLRDIFIWAYKSSAERYAAVQNSLGEPNPFKLKYRNEIKQLISKIIKEKSNRKKAIVQIQEFSQQLPSSQQKEFINVVENELMNIHEGNFSKFNVRPSEFKEWIWIFTLE